jgi:hypothetical protein
MRSAIDAKPPYPKAQCGVPHGLKQTISSHIAIKNTPAFGWCGGVFVVFGGVLLFHPGWVVSLALAGLASGFGMGPGVSQPLLTAVTLFFVLLVCVVGCGFLWWVWLRVCGKFSAG